MSDGVSPEEQALIAVRRMRAKLEAVERAQTEPIAIVGAACRFPGATAPEAFWSLLAGGVDAIREVPAGRWPDAMIRGMPASGPEAQARRWGGFLEDVSGFDAGFFGISPREATKMDPQQRILLEVVHDALEDAGIVPSRIAGSDVGVFVGMSNTDYAHLHDPLSSDVYTATGTANSVAAGRLSYVFDLQGPSVVVDTACSSSLVAVHVACESLRRGECSVAIVGGVNLMLSPYTALLTSKIFALSPDGRCRTFDARANGFVRGEGCGVVVLKRLSRAVADGDVVRAKISGSAINQDGRSAGLTAPNALAQKAVIERALKQAKVDAARVGYVEMHGTGTPLGDPIEFDALKETYGQAAAGPCALGAVKTNIGHLEASAGVAGLIKTMLVLEQRIVPPNLHFEQLKPRISLDGTRFVFPTTPQELGPSVRHAAVSSFGISGTNAHVILEAPDPAPAAIPVVEQATRAPRPVVLSLSARTETALAALAGRYAEWLERASPDLEAVSASLSQTRTHHDQRFAVVTGDRAEAAGALRAAARGEILPGASRGVVRARRPKIAFVFSGQGSQWEGMGKELLEEPAFAEKLRECDEAIRAEAGFSVVEAVTREGPASRLTEIEVVQPTLFAMAVSLAALWRTWGVRPSAVVGHSLGEVAAAYVSGALSLRDAARVICTRSRLVRRTVGRGGMIAAELSAAEAEALVQRWAGRVEVAAENGPRTVLLSGETEALAEAMRALEGRGVFVRPVKVDYASHSAQMDELGPDLRRELSSVTGQPGAVPIYSTLTGEVEDGSRLGSEYWVRNLRERVRFAGAIERLVASGHPLFVEVSPHPVLTTAIEPMLGAAQKVVGTLRREQPARRQMLESLGTLHVRGYEGIQWKELGASAPRVRLPTYAYDREHYWVEVHSERARASGHPLLGEPTEVSTERGVHVWETELREEGYLAEHRVLDAAVLAGSSYVEMALQAAAAVLGGPAATLEDVTLIEPLVLVAEARTRVQLVMKAMGGDEGRASFTVSSRRADPNVSGWTVHARGIAVRGSVERPRALPGDDDARGGGTARRIDSKQHYEALAASGLAYGAAFRGVEEIVVSPGSPRSPRSARGRVKATDAVRAEAEGFGWHPALLDAVLQVVAPAIDAGAGTWVPAGMRRIVSAHEAPRLAEGATLAVRAIATGKAEADVEVTDPDGGLVLRIEGLQLSQLREAAGSVIGSWLHEVAWEARPRPDAVASSAVGTWVIFADEGGRWRGIEAGLAARGAEVTVVPPAPPISTYARVLATHGAKLRGIVHACALDGGAPSGVADLEKAQERGTLGVLALIQATAELGLRDPPRIWVLTREARTMSGVAHAPLWGLSRVAAHEHPELRCTVVDVDDLVPAEALCLELMAGGQEREDVVVLHGTERLVPRIHRLQEHAAPSSPAASRPFRLEIDRPGVLERLALRTMRRRAPGPHEVEVEVRAASVNFLDVLSALGVRPDAVPGKPPVLGGECAGIVVAVGEGVTHVGVGDAVIAIAAFAMASHVTTRASFVVRKPAALSFEEAAALPLVSMTAAYGLERLARLQRGERVLVHAGAGGVGLAAIRIAQRLGAEVFATAGRPDKRDYLRSIGVAHVMDSRTLDFAREVREATKGEGVDVVLNCLTGPALTASLDVLAPYGRFVEIGKRDIYDDSPVGLFAFRKNISYFAVDFARMLDERPALVSDLLAAVALRAAEGELAGLPVTAHPMSKAADAFGTMAAARHVGKLVLTLPDPEVRVAPARFELDPRGSYLVTGGLGGLGLRVAAWLVERGARQVALLGRSAPSGEAVAAIDAMKAAGADVRAYAADVSREDALRPVLDAVRAELGPLRGVVHAAAVLDDGLLARDTPEKFARVMAPKSSGAWNLHAALAGADLDFFVLFSSAASLVGSAGQGSYAAGNAFLDALAEARRSVGLPATSIQWGPWAEIGLAAARADRGERLAAEGMASMTPEQGLEALARILDGGEPLVAVLPWNAKQWLELHPIAGRSPLFDAVRGQGGAPDAQRGDAKLLQALAEGSETVRRERLENHLREQVGRVLRMDPARVPLEAPFGSLGLDSLMGLEIRNRLETTLGLTLSTTLLWTHPTVRGLSAYVAERLGFGAPASTKAAETPKEQDEAMARLNELPVDDLTAMLAAELAASRGRAEE